MKEETRKKYLSLGKHVVCKTIEEYGHGGKIRQSDLREWLFKRAETTTPAYWRRLRTGLALCVEERYGEGAAKGIRNLKNPVTRLKMRKSDLPEGARGRPRARKITEDQIKRIRDRSSVQVRSVMDLVIHTGCRPIEVCGMSVDDQGRVHIRGAKRTEKGDRGADRVMQLGQGEAALVRDALKCLTDRALELGVPLEQHVDNQRRNFRSLVNRVMPRSKVKPGLKSLRHQFGSELKWAVSKGEMTLKEASYLMGHQGTESLSRYGSSKSASGRVMPRSLGTEQELSHVRSSARDPVEAMKSEPEVGRNRYRDTDDGLELG